MASARRGRSGFEIFLNHRDFYVYTQLLPGAEMIYLKVWSGRTPLLYTPDVSYWKQFSSSRGIRTTAVIDAVGADLENHEKEHRVK